MPHILPILNGRIYIIAPDVQLNIGVANVKEVKRAGQAKEKNPLLHFIDDGRRPTIFI
jgi:hypothetical protein